MSHAPISYTHLAGHHDIVQHVMIKSEELATSRKHIAANQANDDLRDAAQKHHDLNQEHLIELISEYNKRFGITRLQHIEVEIERLRTLIEQFTAPNARQAADHNAVLHHIFAELQLVSSAILRMPNGEGKTIAEKEERRIKNLQSEALAHLQRKVMGLGAA